MSIQNRHLTVGNHTVKYENKLQTVLGKLICLFKGHKEVTIKTDNVDLKYCMCCWKKVD